jgi:uncharacterized protein (DUF488 family)
MSRRHPQFNSESLAGSLQRAGIGYEHVEALGGRRPAARDSANVGWREPGFRGYADYMSSADFRTALDHLIALAGAAPTVIMCAEAVPWRCHRMLIADALVARGREVRHVLDARTDRHVLTAFAVVRDGRVAYPDPAGDLFTGASEGRPDAPA